MRLQTGDPDLLVGISENRKIIGFRHRLAHGYDEDIDNAEVWRIIQSSLPSLHTEVSGLLATVEDE